jgi:hypothetical protein
MMGATRVNLLLRVLTSSVGVPLDATVPSNIPLWKSHSLCSTKMWNDGVTHMCHQIRTRGAEVDFDDKDNVIPWIEHLATAYFEGTVFND